MLYEKYVTFIDLRYISQAVARIHPADKIHIEALLLPPKQSWLSFNSPAMNFMRKEHDFLLIFWLLQEIAVGNNCLFKVTFWIDHEEEHKISIMTIEQLVIVDGEILTRSQIQWRYHQG